MKNENYQFLTKLYNDALSEKKKFEEELMEKNIEVKEIDTFLNGLLNKDENDVHVFQPRKVEDIYADVIKENNDKRDVLNDEIKYLEKAIVEKTLFIDNISNVLSDNQNDDSIEKQKLVLSIQETERKKIANDLHDTVLQTLTHTIHELELCNLYVDQDTVKAKKEIASAENNIRTVIDEIRNKIQNMRPMFVDDFGFNEALEKLFETVVGNSNFIIKKNIDTVKFVKEKDNVLELTIYRIIQECLVNAIKHSKANTIYVDFKNRDNEYYIRIADNGIGFDIREIVNKSNHFGVSIMKERIMLLNGTFEFKSENGTEMIIKIPKVK